jgi:hypothetical protein
MLRLRPTAISLTPNDIQFSQERVEARRRATLRDNGRVKVRRGPERSRDEAITPFERIQRLQPPRRAEHISDSEDFSDTSASDASKPQPTFTDTFRHRVLTESSSQPIDYIDDNAHDPSLVSHQQTRPELVLASNRDPQGGLPEPYIPSLQLDGHFDTDNSQLLGPLDNSPSSQPIDTASSSRQLDNCLLPPDSTNVLVVFAFFELVN